MSTHRKHQRSSKVAAPEFDAARRDVRHLTCRLSPPPFFFLICPNSARFAPIWAKTRPFRIDSGGNENRYGRNGHRNMPIRPKQVDMADSGRNSRRNGQRLPFFCFMWPCEREKKNKEKKKERERRKKKMRRHTKKKKMDGRRIKVCNKRI